MQAINKMKYPVLQSISFPIFIIFFCFLSISCSKYQSLSLHQEDTSGKSNLVDGSTPSENPPFLTPSDPNSGDVELPQPTSPPNLMQRKIIPLIWESARPDGASWTEHTLKVIDEEVFDELDTAQDASLFCPRYSLLDRVQKVNFWGMLVASITKYESAFDPTSRMRETTMGIDEITGNQVFSEGLLQLSYQDITGWSFCEFDWNSDKYLSAKDPKKTILDPYKNLSCGIKILASQVNKYKKIVINKGAYWAVIKEGGAYNKVASIAKVTYSIPFCYK